MFAPGNWNFLKIFIVFILLEKINLILQSGDEVLWFCVLTHAQTKKFNRLQIWYRETREGCWEVFEAIFSKIDLDFLKKLRLFKKKKSGIFVHAIRSIAGNFWTNAPICIYMYIFFVVVVKTSFSLRYHC